MIGIEIVWDEVGDKKSRALSSQESQMRTGHNKLGKIRMRNKEIKRELKEWVLMEYNSEEDREANKGQSNTLTWVKKVFNSLCLVNICWGIKKYRRQNVWQIWAPQTSCSHGKGECGLDQCWEIHIVFFCQQVNHRLFLYSPFSLLCYEWPAEIFYTSGVSRKE